MSFSIKLNGKEEKIEESISVAEFLRVKNIRPEVVTVELNDEVMDKEKYGEVVLKDGDRVEFVYYMGGGSDACAGGVAVTLTSIFIPGLPVRISLQSCLCRV